MGLYYGDELILSMSASTLECKIEFCLSTGACYNTSEEVERLIDGVKAITPRRAV
jgi:hypothetical protein